MNEDEIHALEQEEKPKWRTDLTYQPISPVLTEKEYRKLEGCYLLPEHGPRDMQPNVVYFDPAQKQIKFLLLKKAILHSYLRALDVIENADWQNNTRAASGQVRAKKLTQGWLPQIPGRSIGSDYWNVRTAQTLLQPNVLHGIIPLLKEMDSLLLQYLPPLAERLYPSLFVI